MSSTIESSPNTRTLEMTVRRCSEVVIKRPSGDYFVKVTVGSKTMQTKKCGISRRQVVWNETLSFGEVEASSITLGLHRLRTLSFLEPTLVREVTIPLSDIVGAAIQTNPRTFPFLKGGNIEFDVTINTIRPHVLPTQPDHEVAVVVNDTHNVPDHVEHQEPTSTDESGDRNETERHIAEEHDETRDAIKQAQQALKPLEGGWKHVVEILGKFCEVTGPVAGANPFAQLAHGILSSISKPLTKEHERDGRIESLLGSFVDFYDIVNDHRRYILTASDELQDVLKRISLQMVEVAFFIRDYYGNGQFLKRALKNIISTTDETIDGYASTLKRLKEELQLRLGLLTGANIKRVGDTIEQVRNTIERVEITVVRVLEEIEQISQSLNLDDLDYARGAGFNANKLCLDGTRTGILQDMAQWVSLDSSRVLLLLGGAGTGKSAIAHTLASRFLDLGRLGSMFCFSESEKATRKLITLFPHISRDLADLDKNIREELFKAAPTKASRTTSSINDQFKNLVVAPANAIRERLHGPIVIVIDALDESGTVEERRDLLRILASRLNELPPNFRIIITSRPDEDIYKAFPPGPNFTIKRMDDIPPIFTTNDISVYVDKQLEDVTGLDSKMRQNIASHASGLFEWARVGCQFIRSHRGGSVQSRYEAIIDPQNPSTRHKIHGDNLLDSLYHTVLSRALPLDEESTMEMFKFVMAQVLTAFEPLSCDSLNKLFQVSRITPEDCTAQSIVGYLGSLLRGVDRLDTPVVPFHASFRDFLTNRKRSEGFFVNLRPTDIHMDMAWSCLSIMANELTFNICHLETSYLENKAVPDLDKRIEKYIPPYLLYACRFWPSHLCALLVAPPNSESSSQMPNGDKDRTGLMKKLDEVLSHSLLYWLEVLSVTNTVNTGVRQLRQVYSWMKKMGIRDEELVSMIGDIVLFSSYSAKCIARSAPHIYISALPFAPKKSLVARNYTQSNDNTLVVDIGKLENYPSCLNVFQGHTDSVWSVAFSPDGSRIVSGSSDGTIRVWNAEDGIMVLEPIQGHTECVLSVAFNPDGSRIVSGSHDGTIQVWNAEDGTMALESIQGHTSSVWSVAFSPDGSRIISGSCDRTIRIWNAEDGTMTLEPIQGHTDEVLSVAFSPDSSRIVSGSCDRTIRIWNTEDGTMALEPIQGHTDWVLSVVFNPDGSRIVSGSRDGTIRIWNAEDGIMVLDPFRGHNSSVSSVAFSPDGSRIVSGSRDDTIRVWNAEDGTMALAPIQGHTDWVLSVAFNPDGSRIISGSSDRTIRVWNAEDGTIVLDPFQAHNVSVWSVAFSPDSSQIVSGSSDSTIRVWNAEDGTMALEPFQCHADSVRSVAFNPNGSRIVSGLSDGTIRILNAEDGTMALAPIQGHTDWVLSVAFSPDGSRIVSGSRDGTIRIWNAEDGTMALEPFQGHISSVSSVAFSPDGSRIVSGSSNGTIQVWNAENGIMALEPIQGHTECVLSVAFNPDGSRIVSGSSDGTIRIWNAEDGTMALEPIQDRTDSVWSVAFNPDGSRIVSGSSDRTIRVWNAEDGTMALGPFQGHTNEVWSVAFSPDGSRIVSGSCDGTIRVWTAEHATMVLDPPQAQYVTPVISLPLRHETLNHHNSPSIPSSSLYQPTSSPVLAPSATLPQFNWQIEDGWSLGPRGELLFYVPPAHCVNLYGPRTTLLIGQSPTKLDMSRFAHGFHWTKAFSKGSASNVYG